MNTAAMHTTGVMGQSHAHESAKAQVLGAAPYLDDLAELRGTLYAAPILSTVAHGTLHELDCTDALAMPGVHGVVLAADIPGDPILAAFGHDEPIFALDKVWHVGQVMGLVVADSLMAARRAARKVKADITALPAVLDTATAIAQQSFVLPPVHVRRGDADAGLARAPHRLQGTLEVGGQEHFYLEGQIAYVIPQEQNQWLVHSSTQHPGEVQEWVAHALGIGAHAVTVQCRRMGGGFGGKETQAGHLAVWSALAARKFGCPIKLRLDRDDDFMVTGKRHPFSYEWDVGFDDQGQITGLKLQMAAHCGFSADLSGPVADRAIFHADNAYFLSDVSITSYRCKLNTQSHTAFRGFGGPQGVIVIETIMGDIARTLGLDALAVRQRNYYDADVQSGRATTHYQMVVEDNILRPITQKLELSAHYQQRLAAISAWNAENSILQRGIALTPVKFGISFTATLFNQAGALVHVYTDGTVQVNHGGTEMGQGLNTKVAQMVAHNLGVSMARVRVTATDTAKVVNTSATAASTGSDLNGKAAADAARQIIERLTHFLANREQVPADSILFADDHVEVGPQRLKFTDVIADAYMARVQLWSDGFYTTPKLHWDRIAMQGRPFFYFAYGAAVSEVLVDTLTGEWKLLRADVLHDVGKSINPAVDIGQIEGGFIQGMGWLTSEELYWHPESGRLMTHAPSTYKIPTASDCPADFRVKLFDNVNVEDTIHRSKAVGEPPLLLPFSVFLAIRDAVSSVGKHDMDPPLRAPATPEAILDAVDAVKAALA